MSTGIQGRWPGAQAPPGGPDTRRVPTSSRLSQGSGPTVADHSNHSERSGRRRVNIWKRPAALPRLLTTLAGDE